MHAFAGGHTLDWRQLVIS